MDFIIENWYLALGGLCVLVLIATALFNFFRLPKESKFNKLKQLINSLVVKAEEEFKSGEGKKKLEYVYKACVLKFPWIKLIMSLDDFDNLVKEALVKVGIWTD